MKMIKQRVGKIQKEEKFRKKVGSYFYGLLRKKTNAPRWFIEEMVNRCLYLKSTFSEEFKKYADKELFSKVLENELEGKKFFNKVSRDELNNE